MIETIRPRSREEWLGLRAYTSGSSEVPALLGLHPQLSAFEVFATKTGQYKRERTATLVLKNSIHLPPLERGNFLEDKGIELARKLRPLWTITPNTILENNAVPGGGYFYRDTEVGLSATPDAFITAPDRPGRGTLQIKTLAQMMFEKGDWKDSAGAFQLPDYVMVQAIGDAYLSGCQWACAGIMVANFGVDFYLEDVPMHPGVLARIIAAAKDFQRRRREHDPYPPDYARDGDVIKGIYSEDDGGEIDLSNNKDALKLVGRREALKLCETAGSAAEKERKEIDNRLRFMLGNAVRGRLADGRVVEAKTTRVTGHIVQPSSYRAVKIKGKSNVTNTRSDCGGRPQQAADPINF